MLLCVSVPSHDSRKRSVITIKQQSGEVFHLEILITHNWYAAVATVDVDDGET